MKNVLGGWFLVNIPIFLIIAMGFSTGTLQPIFVDITYITHLIFVFTILVILWMGYTSFRIVYHEVDVVGFSSYNTNIKEKKVYYNLEKTLAFPKYAMSLVLSLGFLGTIVGVFIGFQYFPEDAFSDPAKMQQFVRTMLVGFSTELHSLLMGLVCRIWISILVYMQASRLSEIHQKYV